MTVSKRETIKAQRTRKKRQQRMNTLLWVGGFILLLIILFISPTIYNALKPAGDIITITPVPYQLVDGKTIGDPNAKVKIIVYEDFQCPACKVFSQTVGKQLLTSDYINNGLVYYNIQQYPFLDSQSIAKESHQAANASMCAFELGRFWDYHDMLFANQGEVENGGSFNDKRLQAFAESIGLDMNAFDDCFSANKYSADIEAEYQAGVTGGVNRTPTILINGANPFPTYVPTYEEFTAAIDSALAANE
jgi:protein-disulfide isomerase